MMQWRFALFAGHDHYPCGGWGDYVGGFDTVEEAKEYLEPKMNTYEEFKYSRYDWAEIVDLQTKEVVLEFSRWCPTTGG